MQVNGKVGNSTPAPWETPEPIVTKICMGDYVGDLYPMQNFITIRLPPSPQICENVHQVTRLVFLVLPSTYSQDPWTDFHDQYVKWRSFAQGCAFWGSRKLNFIFRPHYPQNANFSPIFDGTWKISRQGDIVAMCCKVISSFVIFAVLDLRVGWCRP